MLNIKVTQIFLIALFVITNPVWADTSVPAGNVSGLWNLAGSPYLLEGDVTVPAGQTLTIEPGVVVFSESWYGLHVQGTLQAIGTETDSILFTTTPAGFPPSNPGWKGIRFENSDDGSEIAYAIIENAKVTAGGAEAQGAGIHIMNSNPLIRNSTLKKGWAGHEGGAIYIEGGSPVIIDNLITDNRVAYPTSAEGGAIAAYTANPEIIGNIISNNTASASGTYPSGLAMARGGAIYLNDCGGMVTHNLIINNTASASATSISSESTGGAIQVWGGTTEIRNNTLSGNSVSLSYPRGAGAGIAVYGLYSNSLTIVNNIIEGSDGGGIYFDDYTANTEVEYNDLYNNGKNFQGNVPPGLGDITTTNYNGDPSDQYYNIFLDLLFVSAAGGNYSLQAGSPAIDAGNPTSPYDPDNTIADQGAFYYDQTPGSSPIAIELTPLSAPVIVPPEGGNIDFSVYLENVSGSAQDFDAWIDISYEGGAPTTVVQRVLANFLPGWSISRPDTFFPVPSSYAAGNYTFTGKVGNHPGEVWDESGFPFEKSGVSGLSGFVPFVVHEAPNPFIASASDVTLNPGRYELMGNYPNPFNPVTTIRYRLPEFSSVNLSVYDATGRLIAVLLSQNQDAGVHEVSFDASRFASGVYLYLLQAGDFQASGKMVLMK